MQSQLKQARIDYERAKSLKDQGVVSAQQYDQADTGSESRRPMKRWQSISCRRRRPRSAPKPTTSRATTVRSSSRPKPLWKPPSSISATRRLTAPFAGVITHKTAHVGNRVQIGEPLLAVVPLGKLYVTANFKETQLTDVRVGQKAEIVADIYPGYTYKGHVDSISMGTGAAFSLLPPENATGNWVKVVQRVPVKIVIDGPRPEDKPLRLGLSVEVVNRPERSQRTAALLDGAAAISERRPDAAQRNPRWRRRLCRPSEPPPDTGTQHRFRTRPA